MAKEECECGNPWNYEHTIYGSVMGGACVVRFCIKCKIIEVGEVKKWRKPKDNEFGEYEINQIFSEGDDDEFYDED